MSSQMIWLEILNKKGDDNRTNKHTNKQTDKLFGSIVCRNKATLASANNRYFLKKHSDTIEMGGAAGAKNFVANLARYRLFEI